MAHTSALYYPWIEVDDENWVKTAILYWDKLYTIMPGGYRGEYRTRHCATLKSAGVLEPVDVTPTHEDVEACTDAALDYLTNPSLVRGSRSSEVANLHPEKLAERLMWELHPEKLGQEVADALESVGDGPFLRVDRGFAEYYMATLAARISTRLGLATITPSDPHEEIVTAAQLRGPPSRVLLDEPLGLAMRRRRLRPAMRPERRDYAEGVLATVVLQGVGVDASTPLNDVLRFRERHSDELANLRRALAAFSDRFALAADDEAVVQLANDIFATELRPQLVELKARLRDSPVHLAVNSVKASLLTGLSGGVLAAALGASFIGPVAVPAVAGLSVVLTAVQHDREQAAARRANPLSYVLAAEQRFLRRRRRSPR